jgi:hypothetical protein
MIVNAAAVQSISLCRRELRCQRHCRAHCSSLCARQELHMAQQARSLVRPGRAEEDDWHDEALALRQWPCMTCTHPCQWALPFDKSSIGDHNTQGFAMCFRPEYQLMFTGIAECLWRAPVKVFVFPHFRSPGLEASGSEVCAIQGRPEP